MMVGFVRAGSIVFWQPSERQSATGSPRIAAAPIAVVAVLIGLTAALSVFGGEVMTILAATATEMATPGRYVDAVLPKTFAEVP